MTKDDGKSAQQSNPLDLEGALKMYRDANGDPRVEIPEDWAALGLFLESDLQGSVAACNHLLGGLGSVADGVIESFQRTGNACRLSLTGETAAIAPLFDETVPPCELALERLIEVVSRWCAFLQSEGAGA